MARFTFTVTLSGEGSTQEQAWNDAVSAFSADPGDPDTAVREETEEEDFEYIDEDECIANGTHLDSVDDDGFCNHCGCQNLDDILARADGEEEDLITKDECIANGTHLKTLDEDGYCVHCGSKD